MKHPNFAKLIFASLLLWAVVGRAHAADDRNLGPLETWTVEGKVFTDKGQLIRHMLATGKRADITHTQCQILTNNMTLKNCPKNKQTTFGNEQFDGLKANR